MDYIVSHPQPTPPPIPSRSELPRSDSRFCGPREFPPAVRVAEKKWKTAENGRVGIRKTLWSQGKGGEANGPGT